MSARAAPFGPGPPYIRSDVMISGVLLDLAGVIYEGERALPGALEAVNRLRHAGLSLRFVNRAVVVGDAGEAFHYASRNRAFRELIDGAKLIALAKNRSFKDADGTLSLDAGAFVAALEFASRRTALVLGKPAPGFFEAALTSMDCPPKHALMVGDDAEADVAGALRAGLGGAVLVRTGKYIRGDEDRFDPSPTVTVENLSAAADWIVAHSPRSY
jgi:HAD superfamily hydrolase (TIGR01458 family)